MTFVSLVSGASLAFASAPPTLNLVENSNLKGYGGYGNKEVYVYPTRLYSASNVYVNELDTKWRTEYSTSKSALESGSGIVTSSGEQAGNIEGGGKNIYFGVPTGAILGGTYNEVHHLIPGTHYYAQFVAENSAGKTTVPLEFTTPPTAKPEVGRALDADTLEFGIVAFSPTEVKMTAVLESNGAATKYSFGYSESPSGSVTSCGSGSVSVAKDFGEIEALCTGLRPETTYYAHLIAANEKGTLDQTTYNGRETNANNNNEAEPSTFTTPTAKPITLEPTFRNITASSAHATAVLVAHKEETHWRFESAPSVLGPWASVPGGAGVISQTEAESFPEGTGPILGVTLNGLTPGSSYYVRLGAENAAGEGENTFGESISVEEHHYGSFKTSSPPVAGALMAHTLDGESVRLIGTVDPKSKLTSSEQTIAIEGAPTGGVFTLTFEGQTTTPLPYDASPREVEGALGELSTLDQAHEHDHLNLSGLDGGPYTVYFTNLLAEKAQSEIEANGAGLTPHGTVDVTIDQQGGVGYDAHYHFQYIGEEQFKTEGEWAKAASTPETDIGSGEEAKFATADLPALTHGETYRYRIVATSNYPGNPVVTGEERTLTVPSVAPTDTSAVCPNEALRTGASARLPDCRGYEQLTPVNKEGSQELFNYGGSFGGNGVLVGEDGEHVMVQAPFVNWGAGPGAGQGPYFFSREADGDWRMTAASIQPETGINHIFPALFTPDLDSFAFSTSFRTAPEIGSKETDYRIGHPGGTYNTFAEAPVVLGATELGLVGASRDLSRLFLAVDYHSLLGSSTHTKQGEDLYEYFDGELRQVNVDDSGATIGTCGAKMVKGYEEAGQTSSVHAVSSDGARAFFEAVPGSNCTEAKNLYMRVGGESTVDIGAYSFVAANAEGSELLLRKLTGGAGEILLYKTESGAFKSLFTTVGETVLKVSEDLSRSISYLPNS